VRRSRCRSTARGEIGRARKARRTPHTSDHYVSNRKSRWRVAETCRILSPRNETRISTATFPNLLLAVEIQSDTQTIRTFVNAYNYRLINRIIKVSKIIEEIITFAFQLKLRGTSEDKWTTRRHPLWRKLRDFTLLRVWNQFAPGKEIDTSH